MCTVYILFNYFAENCICAKFVTNPHFIAFCIAVLQTSTFRLDTLFSFDNEIMIFLQNSLSLRMGKSFHMNFRSFILLSFHVNLIHALACNDNAKFWPNQKFFSNNLLKYWNCNIFCDPLM